MPPAANPTEVFYETCTVAVAHPDSGRINNEASLNETVVRTLERKGYEAAVHPVLGFGSSSTLPMPGVPLGPIMSAGVKLYNLISALIKKSRQRDLDLRLPVCVVQLVVSSRGKNYFVKQPNAAAGILAVLPDILSDLRAERYGRRFVFWIYADSPYHSRININLREGDIDTKRLIRMARKCEMDPGYTLAVGAPSLQIGVKKKGWWAPKKIHAELQPQVRQVVHSTVRL